MIQAADIVGGEALEEKDVVGVMSEVLGVGEVVGEKVSCRSGGERLVFEGQVVD